MARSGLLIMRSAESYGGRCPPYMAVNFGGSAIDVRGGEV